MLDPFMNDSPCKSGKTSAVVEKEQLAKRYGQTINSSAISSNWTWWLGSLLIRIGTKLTKEGASSSSANRNA